MTMPSSSQFSPDMYKDLPQDARTSSSVSALQRTDQRTIAHAHVQDLEDIMGSVHLSFVDVFLGGFKSVVGAIGNALADLAQALFGGYAGNNQSLLVINDGMTNLINRVELLDKVSGFGCVVMREHHKFQGGNRPLKIPFDKQYGPMKNCTLDTSNNRLALNKGTWTITPIISTSGGFTLLGGDPNFHVQVVVLDPEGNHFLTQFIDFVGGPQGQTATAPIPVICDRDGYTVSVMFFHSAAWWTVWGGVEHTKLVANRWDIDTTNNSPAQLTPTRSESQAIAITQTDGNFNVP